MSEPYLIEGALTHHNVGKHFDAISALEGDWVVNGEKITQADSAAVALLLSLSRLAEKNKKKLTFHALPESIMRLAQIGGVQTLIEKHA